MTSEPAVVRPRHRCANHPDRPARAVCMSCRKDVCGECATEWDGINYCVTCLAARRKAERRGAPLLGALVVTVAAVLLGALSVELMVWCGALLGKLL